MSIKFLKKKRNIVWGYIIKINYEARYDKRFVKL